jgi:DNA-binding transcriptional LysR family regulator
MNIRFLETFVWLAKLRNFRLTAEKLHTTQAAVSSRIATLEQDFGVRLFDRSAGDVALTLDGNKALSYAERIIKLTHDMKSDLSDKGSYSGVVRVGVIESIVHSWFPDFVTRIHRMFPKLEIEIASDTTIHLRDQFVKGNLDLVLQTDPITGPNIENIGLCEFPTRWVGSPKLHIQSETLELSDLSSFPLISFSRGSGPHKALERMFADSEKGKPRINCMTSVAAMIRLVSDGLGVAVVPPAIIQRELNEGVLELLRVNADFPPIILLASFRSGPENPLIGRLAQMAQSSATDFALNLGPEIARPPATATSEQRRCSVAPA